MKKFGINIYEKDNTIGFKDRSEWTVWYDSEEDRDEAYVSYTRVRRRSPKDELIEMEIANSPYIDGSETITRTYTKVEEEI